MTRRPLFALAALACFAVAACEDIPVLPKWDADWSLPLPVQTINFQAEWGGTTVPADVSFPIDFPVQQQALDEAFSQFDLAETLRPGSKLALTITKAATTALSIVDTIFVGESAASLTASDPRTLRLRVDLAAGGTTSTDTLTITAANLDMIQDVSRFGGSLYVQARGRAGTGSSSYTFTGSETLTIRVQLIARIAMSR